jgi:pSer/pThr/pTyr-binding forkhead associated (FHA) protein
LWRCCPREAAGELGRSTTREEIGTAMRIALHMIRHGLEKARLDFGPGEYQFGRSPECQVRIGIDNKQAVSRQHCLVRVGEHAVSIRDLRSRNGTVVNGQRIPFGGDRVLQAGDRILVGTFVLDLHLAKEDDLPKAALCDGFREDEQETINVPDDWTKVGETHD